MLKSINSLFLLTSVLLIVAPVSGIDTTPPDVPVNVSADPGGWTRSTTITIRVTLPTTDESSTGIAPYGIDGIYYVVDSSVNYSNAIFVKIIDAIDFGGGVYGFTINITTGNTGQKRVYVWLQDIALNKAADPSLAHTFVDIFPDVTKPFASGAPIFDSNQPTITPLMTWAAAAEPDPVKDIGLYGDVAANPPLVPTTVYDSVENLRDL